jgi:predicted Zn-dependent protease
MTTAARRSRPGASRESVLRTTLLIGEAKVHLVFCLANRSAKPFVDRRTSTMKPESSNLRLPPPLTAPQPGLSATTVRIAPTFQPPRGGTPPKPAEEAQAATPAELYELAVTVCAMGFHELALDPLREVTERAPDHAGAWRKLAELRRLAGNDEAAAVALATADRIGDNEAKWPKGKGERSPTKIEKAERKLREAMARVPAEEQTSELRKRVFCDALDVVSMRHLALQEVREDDPVTAQTLLERALDLSPGYNAARSDYAHLLLNQRYYALAGAQARRLLAQLPRDINFRSILADSLAKTSRFADAIQVLEGMIKDHPNTARFWVSYGNNLHVVGRNDESSAAYRKALAIVPANAEAYSALAALKGQFLTDQDVAAMRGQLAGGRLDSLNTWRMSYALAEALERRKDFAGCFASLQNGAQAFREHYDGSPHAHNPTAADELVRRLKQVFSAETFATRAASSPEGPPRDTPIFVVGMPRAGSTLLEQILASHSMVEGTHELPEMNYIARDLARSRRLNTTIIYPDQVLGLTRDELASIGERYIRDTAIYRRTGRPYFVDKRPWNWMDAGLIHLILPHAKIIDIRRAPMAACFAMYKQLLPADAAFSYDLDHLGRYYNGYVGMMQHYDAVLPGRIHYVRYERLVEDTETEVCRLLDYCGLKFEEGCLRFWETDRAVVTPSAEQVRTPIFRDALEHWRNFEPWLGPLKAALEEN